MQRVVDGSLYLLISAGALNANLACMAPTESGEEAVFDEEELDHEGSSVTGCVPLGAPALTSLQSPLATWKPTYQWQYVNLPGSLFGVSDYRLWVRDDTTGTVIVNKLISDLQANCGFAPFQSGNNLCTYTPQLYLQGNHSYTVKVRGVDDGCLGPWSTPQNLPRASNAR